MPSYFIIGLADTLANNDDDNVLGDNKLSEHMQNQQIVYINPIYMYL